MWIDICFLLVATAIIALATKRSAAGLVVGISAFLLYHPFLMLAKLNPTITVLALITVCAAVGFGARLVARMLKMRPARGNWLGALGGLILSFLVVISFSVSLPIQKDLNKQLLYPPNNFPQPFASGVKNSKMIGLGRNILFFPLLNLKKSPLELGALRVMHAYFIHGEPWKD